MKKEIDKNMDEDVRELVARAREGDSSAFAVIYDSYYTPIYRFIFFQVKHKEEAEDLSQITFLKAFNALDRFEERGAKFSTWLYTIARNSVIDSWKKKRDYIFNKPEIIETVSSGGKSAEDLAKIEEATKTIIEMIDQLSKDQREIMILYFIEELSYKEISRIVGKKEDAIRALKYRALKSLKSKINGLPQNYEI